MRVPVAARPGNLQIAALRLLTYSTVHELRAVELGFRKPRFLGFQKNIKISKAQFRFLFFFILCNLINRPHIKILNVIGEIHQS